MQNIIIAYISTIISKLHFQANSHKNFISNWLAYDKKLLCQFIIFFEILTISKWITIGYTNLNITYFNKIRNLFFNFYK